MKSLSEIPDAFNGTFADFPLNVRTKSNDLIWRLYKKNYVKNIYPLKYSIKLYAVLLRIQGIPKLP